VKIGQAPSDAIPERLLPLLQRVPTGVNRDSQGAPVERV
jgi:hypothetical protein